MKRSRSPWSKAVKIEMAKKDWKVKDLAKIIGMSPTHTCAVINGRVISKSAAKAISDVLNIEQSYVVDSAELVADWCAAVREARVKKEMSVYEVAEKAGKSLEYTSAIINGRIISEPTARVISEVLGIKQSYLISAD